MKSHRPDPTLQDPRNADGPPVRILGGIAAVLILSMVAVVLSALDRADRSRFERHVAEARHGGAPKPWTEAMSGRTIDAPRIPRDLRPAEHTAA